MATGTAASRLMELAQRLAGGERALVERACEAIVADGALSPEMARWALATTCARFVSGALDAIPMPRDLDGESTALILAHGVPTAPLRALALALLRGSANVTVYAPPNARRLTEWVCGVLDPSAREIVAARTPSGAAFLEERAAVGANPVIAYGTDESLRVIDAALPNGCWFEGRGHGLGIALVQADHDGASGHARALAEDVAAYDQAGCLSPRAVYVLGGSAGAVGAALDAELAKCEAAWPRGPVDVGLASRIAQWQGLHAARAIAFHRGRTHAVAVHDRVEVPDAPGMRNIAVYPIASLAELCSMLAPIRAQITTLGIGGVGAPASLRDALGLPACVRAVPVGIMQDPPLDGYEDPRPPLISRRPGADRFVTLR